MCEKMKKQFSINLDDRAEDRTAQGKIKISLFHFSKYTVNPIDRYRQYKF